MAPEQRSAIENEIFLCTNCSATIDKNNGIDYPIEVLKTWKLDHEKWTKSNLNKRIDIEPASTIINVSSTNHSGDITAGVLNIGDPREN